MGPTRAGAVHDRSHGERARYVHGPDENGTPGVPCRCAACTEASSAYERARERQVLYGRWQPYVDARRARDHLRSLASQGIGWRRAAALAGIGNGTVSKLLFGGPGDRQPTRRIRPETEAKILAVRPSLAVLGSKALVDATGPQRRLQALVAAGHSQASLGRQLGITPQNFTATMTHQRLTAATARAICDLYDRLWNVPPDESAHRARIAASRARNTARANGWAPPLAWDDDAIDLPGGRPADGWRRGSCTQRRAADLAEDAAFVREQGGYRHAPVSEVAMRLGVTRPALEKALSRVRQADMPEMEAG